MNFIKAKNILAVGLIAGIGIFCVIEYVNQYSFRRECFLYKDRDEMRQIWFAIQEYKENHGFWSTNILDLINSSDVLVEKSFVSDEGTYQEVDYPHYIYVYDNFNSSTRVMVIISNPLIKYRKYKAFVIYNDVSHGAIEQ